MHSTQTKPHFSVGSSSGESFVRVRLSRRTIRNIVAALCAVAIAGFGVVWAANKFLSKPQGSIGTTYTLRPGPWGDVKAQPILIEAPASLLSVNFRLGDGRWYFRANTPEEVAAFLRGAGLSSEQIARLTPGLQRIEGRDGLLATTPPEDLVRSLSMDTRSVLYDKLAGVPENFAQVEPFRTTEMHLDAWLDAEKLPPELIAEVRSLMWRRGSGLFFSDYNIVANKVVSPVEKLNLLRQLTHKSSVVLTLQIPGAEGVDPLVAYFGVNGRRDKVEPVLRAIGEAGGGNIGFANMLPAFARSRLYRFPDALPGSDLSPDCHWTTFNFFKQGAPDDTLNSVEGIEKVLRERYDEVKGEPRFGDVVLLTLPDGSSIHSATYIADNIVFTKNGPSMAAPFLFSTAEDMLAFYPASELIRLTYYRLKGA
jgi:hypothetical protein